VSVSKYKVLTSQSTKEAGPSFGVFGTHLRECVPETGFGDIGSRRFSVGYDAAATPVSANTRNESALLVGSMIRANTNWRKLSLARAALSKPSTS
jgi:hypothetical protein